MQLEQRPNSAFWCPLIGHMDGAKYRELHLEMQTEEKGSVEPLGLRGDTPERRVKTCLAQSDFLQALELAAKTAPHKLDEVFAHAGSYFAAHNQQEYVWLALSGLEQKQRATPRTMLAFLDAAKDTGHLGEIQAEIEAFLKWQQAPDVQALHAILYLGAKTGLAAVEQAYAQKQTPLTAFALGRVIGARGDATRAESLFRISMRLSESEVVQDAFATVRAAWALGVELNIAGRYRESAHWLSWADDLYHAKHLNSPRLELLILNDQAYTQILLGQTMGLQASLERGLAREFQGAAQLLPATLGDWHLAQKDAQTALHYYEMATSAARRNDICDAHPNLARCLAELGRADEALTLAEQSYTLAYETRSQAGAALGLARLLVDCKPERALNLAREAFELAPRASLKAHAGAVLARLHWKQGNIQEAKLALKMSSSVRHELSGTGLVLLECEDLPELDGEVATSPGTLELKLLGHREIKLGDQDIVLADRQLELLCLLVLAPGGLSSLEIAQQLFGDEPKSIKAALARLRKVISVLNKPFRLDMNVKADFLEVRQLLTAGETARAAQLYRGSLLPASESPRIREEAELLEEMLARAASVSDDVETLYKVCAALPERLELWEQLLKHMNPNDSRYQASSAVVERLRKNLNL